MGSENNEHKPEATAIVHYSKPLVSILNSGSKLDEEVTWMTKHFPPVD